MWEDKDRGRFVGKSSNALKISLDPICLHTAQCPHCQGDSSESPRAPGRVLLAPQGCCFLSGNVDPPRPLGVLVHVIEIGGHDEVFGVVQASLVSVLLPAGVIALVGDVALTSTGLELPEVQPGLVVLQTTSVDLNIKAFPQKEEVCLQWPEPVVPAARGGSVTYPHCSASSSSPAAGC